MHTRYTAEMLKEESVDIGVVSALPDADAVGSRWDGARRCVQRSQLCERQWARGQGWGPGCRGASALVHLTCGDKCRW